MNATTPSPTRTSPALYVATDLDCWESEDPALYDRDVTVHGKLYRRLDPAYFAWLRHKVGLAGIACARGRISEAALEVVRQHFQRVHGWAVAHLDERALRESVKARRHRAYIPPIPKPEPAVESQQLPPHLYPNYGNWSFTHPVPPSSVAKVDAIREEALALGWTEASLYQNRGSYPFPFGGEYGLVCYLNGARRTGEVTRESIKVISPRPYETTNRFYNPAIEHPWKKKVRQEEIA